MAKAIWFVPIVLLCIGHAHGDALHKGHSANFSSENKATGQPKMKSQPDAQDRPFNVVMPDAVSPNPQCESGGQECANVALESKPAKAEASEK